jgi:hypothetical protein
VDRKDLQVLAKIRLREGKALLSLGLSDGAHYLAGYAVECAEKLGGRAAVVGAKPLCPVHA